MENPNEKILMSWIFPLRFVLNVWKIVVALSNLEIESVGNVALVLIVRGNIGVGWTCPLTRVQKNTNINIFIKKGVMCDHFEIDANNRHSFFSKWYNKKDRLLSLTIKKMNTENERDVWKDLAQLKNVIKKLSLKYERMTRVEWRTRLFSHLEPARLAHLVFKQNQTTLVDLSIENVDFTNTTIFFDLINDNNISLFSLCVESCIFNDETTFKFSKFLEHQSFIRLFFSRKTFFEKNNLKRICQVLESFPQLYNIEFGNAFEKDQDLSCWRNLFDTNTNIRGVSICVTNQKEVDYFCEEILTRRKTKLINIESLKINFSANIDKLADILKQDFVTYLSLHNVIFHPSFFKSLATNTSLQTIMLSGVSLLHDDFNRYFELFVQENKNLKYLSFNNCFLDTLRVCSTISKSKSITNLTMSRIYILTIVCVQQLIELLSSVSLEKVDVFLM